MSKYPSIINKIKELNDKCYSKIQKVDKKTIKRDNTEYVIIKNYLQRKSFYIDDLASLTNNPKKVIYDLVKKLHFIRFKERKLLVQKKYLEWIRFFIKDLIYFLNYPKVKVLNVSIKEVNYFVENQKRSKEFKIALVGALESNDILFFSKDELEEMKNIIKNASWGISMYYFRQLYSIYSETYPEIQTIQVKPLESEEIDKEDIDLDDFVEVIKDDIDIKDLIEENQKLNDEISESRAVCDFLAMQNDDLKSLIESLKKEAYDQNLLKIFKNFNSLENNKALDAFYIAKFTLNELKKSGWKPSPPELKSALFIFDLFSEFFKRQKVTTKYDLGEKIEITLANVKIFDYKGTEIKEGMKVMAKVLSPAWYFNNKIISRASIIEIKNKED